MPTIDTVLPRLTSDQRITRAELADAELADAAANEGAGVLADKLTAVRDWMTTDAADAFDRFRADMGTDAAAALRALTQAPAAGSTSPLATRLAAVSGTADKSLVERRAVYQTVIESQTKTIGALEGEVRDINARVQQKTAEATNLISEQNRLIAAIEEKRGIAAYIAMCSGAAALVSFGIGGLIGGGAVAACTVAIASLQSDLERVRQRRDQAQAELDALRATAAAYAQRQAELNGRLAALTTAAAELDVARQQPTKTLTQLQTAADTDQKLVANLNAQIVLLQTLKAQATGREAALDAMIASLQKDVASLEDELARCNASIVVALVDVALTGFGVDEAIRIEGLSIARRNVLTAGLDLVRGDPGALAATLVQGLVHDGVVAATGSAVLATTMATLLNPSARGKDASAAVTALIPSATTDVQRALLSELAKNTTLDVESIAKAVVAEPGLDDDMQRTLAALVAA